MTKVNIKKLNEKATIPTYGSEFSAGADLYALADEAITIEAGKTVLVQKSDAGAERCRTAFKLSESGALEVI